MFAQLWAAIIAVAWAACSIQASENTDEDAVLSPPVVVRIELKEEALIPCSDSVRRRFEIDEMLGVSIPIVIEQSGMYRIVAHSHHCDTYVVVRDESGDVVAESDSGPMPPHAQVETLVTVDLVGQTRQLRVDVTAWDGLEGAVDLTVEMEPFPELNGLSETVEQDLLARSNIISRKYGEDSPQKATALVTLGRAQIESGSVEVGLSQLLEAVRIKLSLAGFASASSLKLLVEVAHWALMHDCVDVAMDACKRVTSSAEFFRTLGRTYCSEGLYQCYVRVAYESAEYDKLMTSAKIGLALQEESDVNFISSRVMFLLYIARVLEMRGDLYECLIYVEQAEDLLGLPECIADETSVALVIELLMLHAVVCAELGEWDQVEILVERAMCYGSGLIGRSHPSIIRLRIQHSDLLLHHGRYNQAYNVIGGLYDELAITFPSGDLSRILAGASMVRALEHTQQGEEARRILVDTMNMLAGFSGAQSEYAEAALSCGDALASVGDFVTASALLADAISKSEGQVGSRSPLGIELRFAMASALYSCGDVSRSIEVLRELVASDEADGNLHGTLQIERVAALCLVLTSGGFISEGRERAEAMLRQIKSDQSMSGSSSALLVSALASVFVALGNLDRATEIQSMAVEMYESDSSHSSAFELSTACEYLAGCYLDLDNIEMAEKYLRRAIETAKAAGYERNSMRAGQLTDLASIQARRGEHERARKLIDQALALTTNTYVSEAEQTAMWHSMAVSAAQSEDWSTVADCCELMMATESLSVVGERNVIMMGSISELLALAGRPDRAWEIGAAAWLEGLSQIETGDPSLTEYERALTSTRLAELLRVLDAIASRSADPARLEFVNQALCAWKGSVWKRARTERQAARLGEEGGDSSAVNFRELQAALNRAMGALGGGATETPKPDDLQDSLMERRVFERAVAGQGAAYSGSSVAPRSAEGELGTRLAAANAVLLNFVVLGREPDKHNQGGAAGRSLYPSPQDVIVWVSTGEAKSPIRIGLGNATDVRAAIDSYLRDLRAHDSKLLAGGEAGPFPAESAARVRHLIWDPIAKHVAANAHLLISPDGFLGAFPFECIVDESGRYLVEKHSIVYGIDVGDVAMGGEPIGSLGSALIVGGIDRSKDASNSGSDRARPFLARGRVWPALKWSTEECSRVLEIVSAGPSGRSSTVLLGGEATENRVRERLPFASIVHFATHGFYPNRATSEWAGSPLRGDRIEVLADGFEDLAREYPGILSGLVLAEDAPSSKDSGDDGMLTAEEVSWLDLRDCETVVLSACGTGLGEPLTGEGLIGLRRAFRLAGAHSVISSLWPVSDRATAELMEEFYRNLLLRGMGRGASLRAAQRSVLDSNRRKHGSGLPTTWAAFVLDGAWN